MRTPGVLIVDDEVKLCRNIALKLKREGYEAYEAHNGGSALRKMRHLPIRVVILDYMLTDMTGLDVLKKIKEFSPHTVVYMLTAYGNIESAVLAMKWGAADYLNKPVDLKQIVQMVAQAFEGFHDGANRVIFHSRKMQEVRRLLERVTGTDASVMFIGENGVGKSTIARWVHDQSLRKDAPFFSVGCASMPEALLDQELFGPSGKLAASDGGTLFLDEIGELPPLIQSKLGKFLEEGRFQIADDFRYRSADVRILAANERPLKPLVQEGRFLDDLYYRLSLVEVNIPPLRERSEDIPPLVRLKLEELNAKYDKRLDMAESLIRQMTDMPWEGNIPELFNTVERMHLLKMDGVLDSDDLSALTARPAALAAVSVSQQGRLHEVLEEVEEQLIRDALHKTGGNHSKTAELLGISRNTLLYKIKRFKR